MPDLKGSRMCEKPWKKQGLTLTPLSTDGSEKQIYLLIKDLIDKKIAAVALCI
jgi:hypothetical protein